MSWGGGDENAGQAGAELEGFGIAWYNCHSVCRNELQSFLRSQKTIRKTFQTGNNRKVC